MALDPVDSARIQNTTVQSAAGARFQVRAGKLSDVPGVTRLLHDAFTVWKERGLVLGPMSQTEEQTAAHLVEAGYVAENAEGRLVGTFSLDEGRLKKGGNNKISFIHNHGLTNYSFTGDDKELPYGRLLEFKKAAVSRDTAHAGLGSALYALAEEFARSSGYSGMALETAKETDWLYDWYTRLGFKEVGTYRYPGRAVDTILMIKPFAGRK